MINGGLRRRNDDATGVKDKCDWGGREVYYVPTLELTVVAPRVVHN